MFVTWIRACRNQVCIRLRFGFLYIGGRASVRIFRPTALMFLLFGAGREFWTFSGGYIPRMSLHGWLPPILSVLLLTSPPKCRRVDVTRTAAERYRSQIGQAVSLQVTYACLRKLVAGIRLAPSSSRRFLHSEMMRQRGSARHHRRFILILTVPYFL